MFLYETRVEISNIKRLEVSNLKENSQGKLFKIIRFIPLTIMLMSFLFFTINYRDMSIYDILNFIPSNYLLAGIILIFIFAFKSISIFPPLTILYIGTSIIFPWYLAIIVNLIGLFVCMTIPYYIGRFTGKDLVDNIIEKYPKVNKINQIKMKNEWFFVFIVKTLGFIPNEVGSLVLGSLNTKYITFVTAAVIAKIPGMVATTLLGSNANNPGTTEFKISIAIVVLVFIFIIFISRKYRKSMKF